MSRATASRVLRQHVPFAVGVCCCLAAGWFELTRARDGHTIAWVYTFEWPLFAVVLAIMWWRSARDRVTRRPGPPGEPGRGTPIPEDDPGLRAWRRYLAELGHDVTADDEAPG